MIRLLFLTRSLEAGGAEAQLIELIERLDKSRFEVAVVTFYAGVRHWGRIQAISGVRLYSLDKKGRWDIVGFFLRLHKVFREMRPQIVCAYNGANEVTFVLGKLFRAKTVLSIRSTFWDTGGGDWLHTMMGMLSAYFSYYCSLIVAISETMRREYVRKGYCEKKITVIPIGFDTNYYAPKRELGSILRTEWGIAPSQFLIGHIGRLDPRKDHKTFVRAAALLSKERGDVCFVYVGGRGTPCYRAYLEVLVSEAGLQDKFIWAGVQSDMPAVYNALDISAVTSFSEGGPNTLGEAMCCEVPTVTTDVGDAASLRGDPRWIVAVGDAEGMAERWRTLLVISSEARAEIGRASRQHILSHYTSVQLTRRMEAVFESLLSEG
ncbi:MAG: glycosyltransferase [Armatimonadetes bacterium]|nr:glycosyltransferase [Armatimonadota bacterium]